MRRCEPYSRTNSVTFFTSEELDAIMREVQKKLERLAYRLENVLPSLREILSQGAVTSN